MEPVMQETSASSSPYNTGHQKEHVWTSISAAWSLSQSIWHLTSCPVWMHWKETTWWP
jgi:hypothetical protein